MFKREDVENALNLSCTPNLSVTTEIRHNQVFLSILLGCEGAPIKNVFQSMSNKPLIP